jgi:[citrate (pro-3S)-lyase] ligase
MNFEDTDFRYEFLDRENPFDLKLVSNFLEENGYDYYSEEVDCTVILYNLNDEIIGTGSYKNQTLKYVVVAGKFRETTAFPLIVSYLSDKILEKNERCFVFTKPQTSPMFEGLGFKEIANAEPLFSVLEFGYKNIGDYQDYLRNIKRETTTDNIAAIVVNCNPFTLGHKYLIEKAATESELLYLFVVEEDFSVFPYEARLKIIKEGIKHLDNVVVIATGPYIVSGSIFPNYFLKLESWNLISQKQAELDVKIFAKYIVPVLGLKKRYVGTENYCRTTQAYNDAMSDILPEAGCELIVVDRKAIGKNRVGKEPNCISASKVRKAMKEGSIKDVMEFLPQSTRNYLLSEEGKTVWEKLRGQA